MAWIFLLIAGSLEILGVVLLNELSRTQNKLFIILLGLAFILSFSTLKPVSYTHLTLPTNREV